MVLPSASLVQAKVGVSTPSSSSSKLAVQVKVEAVVASGDAVIVAAEVTTGPVFATEMLSVLSMLLPFASVALAVQEMVSPGLASAIVMM